ncbi:hypothetical protein BDM02DRAFT_2358747 [Thelephora ganbajun]|uniref:Uncharacterized protein n=1 Tax=Thelephora ganbajun TaxID=370292 RepID=A0ACB6ZE79_THEGA|nr:hypothetical protein BDM02DRAFT_2358747 [Thelephora ganbajun]
MQYSCFRCSYRFKIRSPLPVQATFDLQRFSCKCSHVTLITRKSPLLAPDTLRTMVLGKEKVKCPHCDNLFMPSGIGSHRKACKKKLDAAAQERLFLASLLAKSQRAFYTSAMGVRLITVGSGSLPVPKFVAPWEKVAYAGQSSTKDSNPRKCNH